MPSPPWTRRQFSQTIAASALASLLPAKTFAAPAQKSLAYVGIAATLGKEASIQVFRVSGSHWHPLQAMPAAAPAHLEPHPNLPILYAVHDVALWDNLPRGAVSAYTIAPTGHLTLRNTQPLSLSATHPRHAAISPDGRFLLVAASQGGLYNLLPIAPDGSLQPHTAIRKELGLFEGDAAKPASPHQVLFHPNGSALTADSGQESIALFGIEQASIRLHHRVRTHAGAGPSQIALSGDWLYAQHAASGSIAAHRLAGTEVHPPARTFLSGQPGPARMALHPNGRFLLTANDTLLTSLKIDPHRGSLSVASSIRLRESPLVLAFDPGGAHLYGVTGSGEIFHLPFNPSSGALSQPQSAAQADAAISLLVRPA